MNPENSEYLFFKEYCKQHPKHTLDFICDRQECPYFLNLQCVECRNEGLKGDHAHQCLKIQQYIKRRYDQILQVLTEPIKEIIKRFTQKINSEIMGIERELTKWYTPLQESTTEKDFINTIENPTKWEKIVQTSTLKSEIIERQLKMISKNFTKDLERMCFFLNTDMKQLRYRLFDEKWRFDKQYSHGWVNVSGAGDRVVDKKIDTNRFCVAMVNQPITPYKNQISFTINSQNPFEKSIVLGLGHRKTLRSMNMESDLKQGIYGIYQASNAGSSINAYSLHYSDQVMHYKEMVGWNYRSGDTVIISLKTSEDRRAKVLFKKKGTKDTFEMFMHLSEVFLYPFVALYAPGDKVSIDTT